MEQVTVNLKRFILQRLRNEIKILIRSKMKNIIKPTDSKFPSINVIIAPDYDYRKKHPIKDELKNYAEN
ncbi:hypothetical protein RclHR1_00200040 [Rhizophagus clarus]|uniref:Uncharacterized protein n=1 Tax=Rhizophagus clarus TaxID=94130 RepID=A0A2Z6QQN9_9GLOM|nr:hypothetical protein RclHR1_00200040 [Rhizophagus clarus]GES99465.1 hypothetical protein RCL_jg14964.t1 [Rhizophagus clarus]